MKRNLNVLFIVSVLFFCFVPAILPGISFAAAGHAIVLGPSPAPDQTIPLGEHLVYDVFWNGIPVGVGDIWVKEKTMLRGQEVFHIVGTVQSNSVLSKIYPVKNEGHSWIDARTLQSLQFQKKVDEGFIHADEKDEFDAAHQKGTNESFKTGQKKEYNVTAPVNDFLSTIYWARRQTLIPGRTMKVVLTCDQQDWVLSIKVLSRQMEELRGQGLTDALLVELKTQLKGTPEKNKKTWVYLKNDRRRTPVLIKFPAVFGSVDVVLRSTADSLTAV